jgi:hypothetical protein
MNGFIPLGRMENADYKIYPFLSFFKTLDLHSKVTAAMQPKDQGRNAQRGPRESGVRNIAKTPTKPMGKSNNEST